MRGTLPRIFLLTLSAVLATCGAVSGREYFITNKPGTGAGTAEDPFGMADLPSTTDSMVLGRAIDVLHPGDVLTFRGGDYSIRTVEGKLYFRGYLRAGRPGEPDKRITLRGRPGETVRLIHAGGGQPMLGGGEYVTFQGFVIETGPGAAARLGGVGVEVAYCHIKGVHVATSDNHDGLRLEGASDFRIHHNVIEGVTGDGLNSAGIKLYRTTKLIIEDNYIHRNTAGILDKDSGLDNTYRRNLLVNNAGLGFYGRNQGKISRYMIYDNVVDGQISLHCGTDGCEIYNNLVRGGTLTGAWAGGALNNRIYNNIVVSKARSILAFYDHGTPFTAEQGRANLSYMDHNLYDAEPVYSFGEYTPTRAKFTLAAMREKGLEKNSQVVADASEIFEDETTWRLKPRWAKAGKDGDIVGPHNLAEVLDVSRYGPAAVPRAAAAAQ